jgi:hypothetical protein
MVRIEKLKKRNLILFALIIISLLSTSIVFSSVIEILLDLGQE